MPVTLEDSPPMTRRLEDAVVALLEAIDGLDGLTIKAGGDSDDVASPRIVVNASRGNERIHNSGVIECAVSIILKTTTGEGPKASTDAQLLDYDAAIESMIWGGSMESLASAITGAAAFLRVYTVLNPSSSPTVFNDVRREITYSFLAHCISLPDTE